MRRNADAVHAAEQETLKAQLLQLKAQHASTGDRASALHSDLDNAMTENAQLRSAQAELRDALDTARAKLSDMGDRANDAAERLTQAAATEAQLRTDLGAARMAISEGKDREATLKAALASEQAEHTAAATEAARRLAALEEATGAARSAEESVVHARREAEAQIENLKAKQQRELAACTAANSAEREAASRTAAGKLKQATEAWDRERAILEKQHADEVARINGERAGSAEVQAADALVVQAELRKKIEGLSAELGAISRLLEDEQARGKSAMAEFETSCKAWETDRTALEYKISDLSRQLASADQAAAQQAAKAAEAADAEAAAAEARLAAVEDQWAKKLTASAATNKSALDAAKVAAASQAAQVTQAQDDADQLRAMVARKEMELKAAYVRVEQAEQDLRNTKTSIEAAHADALEAATLSSTAQVDELKIKLADALRAHAAELDELKLEHSAAANAARIHAEWEADAASEQHQVLRAQAIALAEKNGSQALDSYRQQAEREKTIAISDTRKQVEQELETKFHAEFERLTGESEMKIAGTAAMVRDLEKKGRAAEKRAEISEALVEQLGQDAERQSTELKVLRTEVERLGKESLSIRQEHASSLKQLEEESTARHKVQLEDVIAGYRNQFARAKQAAGKMELGFKQKIELYEKEIRDAQARFDARPARESDQVRISELEKEVVTLKAETVRLQSDNTRFKAAVMNQEQALNMHFRSNPAVGTMNPLGTRKTPLGAIKSPAKTGSQSVRGSMSGQGGLAANKRGSTGGRR